MVGVDVTSHHIFYIIFMTEVFPTELGTTFQPGYSSTYTFPFFREFVHKKKKNLECALHESDRKEELF